MIKITRAPHTGSIKPSFRATVAAPMWTFCIPCTMLSKNHGCEPPLQDTTAVRKASDKAGCMSQTSPGATEGKWPQKAATAQGQLSSRARVPTARSHVDSGPLGAQPGNADDTCEKTRSCGSVRCSSHENRATNCSCELQVASMGL